MIDDHKVANEDKLVKLTPIENIAVAAIAPWVAVLNDFAVSDSFTVELPEFKLDTELQLPEFKLDTELQLPEFKLYPELQLVQTEESVAEHIWQLLGVHFLTVNLIMFWTGLANPAIFEIM